MVKMVICEKCKKRKIHHAKGLCDKCYKKQNLKVCKNCGEEKPHKAKGLCNACYKKQNLKVCKECGELKKHEAFGLCKNCYNHKKGIHKPYTENEECSLNLGLMAEELLSDVFKNVTRMPNNHKGYDFVCDKEKKIDVKSSVLIFDKKYQNYKGYWYFHIRKNTIADYFLCMAVDNRKNKKPQHLWLIPSGKVNHLTGLGISKNQTHKWSEYEMNLDKTLKCYNTLKQM